jgi:hypothetical protein
VETGFDSDIGGNVPDWDNTESRESDEDAAWRDLVARFDAPATTTEPAPWPEREDVPQAPGRGTREADSTGDADGNQGARGAGDAQETDGILGADGTQGADGTLGVDGTLEADGIQGDKGAREADRTEGDRGTGEAGGLPEVRDLPGADGDTGTLGSRAGDTQPTAEGAGLTAGEARGAADADARLADADARLADGDAREADGADGAGGRGPAGAAEGGTREAHRAEGIRGPRGMRGYDDEGVRGALEPDGTDQPDVIQAARHRRRTEARSIRARQTPAAATGVSDDGEHYVPPPPPPLPKLDSMAKGAWAALFGGPAYLVVATAAGWSVPGIAAFCAVAAFVTGFVILVLRMNDPGPGGPDDGDDGAVV